MKFLKSFFCLPTNQRNDGKQPWWDISDRGDGGGVDGHDHPWKPVRVLHRRHARRRPRPCEDVGDDRVRCDPEGVHAATRKCPHGNDVDLDAVRWREGCNDVVMFLGDLLDNRRSASADPYGVCATPRTQFAMMDVLVRLKGEAQAHGGDVVLVLGNHDVENAIDHHGTGSEQMADFFCNAYAPAVQDDGKASTASGGVAGFSEEHRAKVLPRLAALSGFQVVRRVKGESHSVLCLHGGLSPELPRIVGLRPGRWRRTWSASTGCSCGRCATTRWRPAASY